MGGSSEGERSRNLRDRFEGAAQGLYRRGVSGYPKRSEQEGSLKLQFSCEDFEPKSHIPQANEITSLLPHAAAYLRSVANDGECFSLDSDASSRETAEAVVPIRSATCA
jgi:hypothetical protein